MSNGSALWPDTMDVSGEEREGKNPLADLWPDLNEKKGAPISEHWETWLTTMFPKYVKSGFAPRHGIFWRHIEKVTIDNDPAPFVGIWPRGGAKSTSAELAAVYLGLTGRRRYGIYIRDTQDRADDSVSNIGALLEDDTVERHYPPHAERKVGKFGNPQGWRRNRLRTAGGLTIDALGLDVAARGVKIEDQRPDFIILDDVDGRHDTEEMTLKKLQTIKESILPAGATNVFVIAIQNLIIPNGVFARLADGRADFLALRIVSGPEPALWGMETKQVRDKETKIVRTVITGGTPSWQGQGLRECQHMMDLIGPVSFDRECQHNVDRVEGAIWTPEMINKTRVGAHPPLRRIVVAVDPSGGGDEVGIVVEGLGFNDHLYVLADYSCKASLGPLYWGRQVSMAFHEWGCDRVVAERNFGGDMVKSNLKVADPTLPVVMVNASRGKDVRAEPVASLYGSDEEENRLDGEERMHHVGYFPNLEREMTRWVPGTKPSPNRMDALVWAAFDLWIKNRKKTGRSSFVRGSRRVG